MSHSDFQRVLPDASNHFQRERSLWSYTHVDAILLILLLILAGYGLFVYYSASGQSAASFQKQLVRYGVAFSVMIAAAWLNPRHFRRWAPWLFVGGVGLLVAVLLFGVGAKGAQRWIAFPGLPRFQPSEIMKLIVPMTLAWFFAEKPLPPSLRNVVIVLMLIAIPVLLIAKQPDLGTSLLIGSSGVFVLLLSGIRWRYIFGASAVATACGPLLWMGMRDYQRQRVLTFLDPESDPLGSGWNIIQAKTAIGSGGIDGKGWLNGTQSQLDFLPESHTDFILAVLAEELGLVGVLALLAIYLCVIARGLYIATHAQDTFGRLLAGSLTLTFFVYVFVNFGMVSGILPVVGVPLPLVSFGGTSIVTLLAGFGIIMSIHTHRSMVTR
ncbi:rod shape-determining protein RodA [Motiliproteus sp. MSK22-1]|uniref:rod shape-determining protein RodA n=1 Tax=Motiliproteus sp. MSK22-1 TaxID=1897630 RepID=UPI000976500F|nr:rod shape-determining protein RodA [Motiliproteus sp. MSK22-1]OMH33729.1 rod shape-determining protein RodA [Motiliproteus sp. MSK22-1]